MSPADSLGSAAPRTSSDDSHSVNKRGGLRRAPVDPLPTMLLNQPPPSPDDVVPVVADPLEAKLTDEAGVDAETRSRSRTEPPTFRDRRRTRKEHRDSIKAVKQNAKRRRRDMRDGKGIAYIVVTFLIVPMLLAGLAYRGVLDVKQALAPMNQTISSLKESLKRFTLADNFPLADAQSQALRLTRECFTFQNAASADQRARLKAAVGDVDCGWNGLGNATVTSADILPAETWVGASHAVVAVQVQLYTKPGWFTYYVPFVVGDSKTAILAGPGSIFGLNSGASIFGLATGASDYESCSTSDKLNNEDLTQLQVAAQGLLNGLTGAANVDASVYTASGSDFGTFGTSVTKPVVRIVQGCSSSGAEQFFKAQVDVTGPGTGAQFAQTYAFGARKIQAAKGTRWVISRFGPYLAK